MAWTAATWFRPASDYRILRRNTRRLNEKATAPDQFLDTVVGNSRAVLMLWTFVTAGTAVWSESRLARSQRFLIHLDLVSKIRAAGVVITVAAITHIVVLAVLRAPVQALGWGTRAFLLAVGIAIIRWPTPVAVAWRDRSGQGSISERT